MPSAMRAGNIIIIDVKKSSNKNKKTLKNVKM